MTQKRSINYSARNYGEKSVDSMIRIEPGSRLTGFPSPQLNVSDEITGILIGFKRILNARDGHLDIITTKYAEEEIRDLIRLCGGQVD
jgi:hypothetical protein